MKLNNDRSSSSKKDPVIQVEQPAPSIEIKPSKTTTTTTTTATFSIENPMRSSQQQPHASAASNEEAPEAPEAHRCRCNWMQRPRRKIKGLCVFILSAVAIGLFYIASQAVALATAGTDQRVKVTWWFQVDGIEVTFHLFVLSAVLHFSINAGGGSKLKYWPTFVPLILLVGCILVGVVPEVYQQANNDIETVKFDRRGCFTLDQVDKKFGLLKAFPSIQLNASHFVRYDFHNRTDNDIRTLVDALGRLVAIDDVGFFGGLALSVEPPEPKLESFLVESCPALLFDIFVQELFRTCGVTDCTLLSSSCFENNIVERIRGWKECGKKQCTYETTWCANIDDQVMVDDIFPGLLRMLTVGQQFGIEPQTLRVFDSAFKRYRGYLSVNNLQQQCQSSNIVRRKNHSDASSNSITCDSTKQAYTRTTTHTAFNSTILLSLVFVLFSCSVVLFGDFESFQVQWSAVRVGCCVVGLLMSSLVYIGSKHLQASIGNPVQNDVGLQIFWRVLYLVISYMCMHGGLLVLVPRLVVGGGGGKTKPSRADQENFCPCGSPACCRRGSCCFRTLSFVCSFKEEFWDASGAYFPLKLILMETVEVAIQINSLTTGAKLSHVNDVVLSAIIIAANLIILPLVIALGPKCVASSASSSDVITAAVMVVEVLFDKLYVGVGVLLRYDTFTRSMDLTDQIAVHLALLAPALMTVLDVQDALVLAEHMEAASASGGDYRSSSFARVAGKVDNVRRHPVVVMTFKLGLATSIIVGVVLAAYTSIAARTAHRECERQIGKIASCAKEQFYFADGFFQPTNCAFEQVTQFSCKPDNDVAGLPDAVDAYASMAKLVQINVSNSKSLDRAPLGWAYVPNDNIAIDVHGSKQFFDLPFKLCSSHANLRSLDVSGTVAETTMNWTGQLSGANGSSFDVGSVNDACVIALKKLTSLSLAGNNLTNSQIDDVLLPQLDSLLALNLQHNNIKRWEIKIGEKRFTPILQRYVNKVNSGDGLQLAGNPLSEYIITAEARDEIVNEWIRILGPLQTVREIRMEGCYLDDDAICALAETSRTRKNLRSFNVGGNKFTNVSCLASLLDLEHLGMGDNEINDINPLSTLVKLKYLQLSDNKLTILPPSFSSLVNLERLILYDNSIGNIEGLASLVRLTHLELQKNLITDIQETFAPLVGLKYLDLEDNNISNVTSLRTLYNLDDLCLRGNPINATHVLSLQKELGSTCFCVA